MINWAYIAGFFDGEGTVCLVKGHICVKLYQCEKSVLLAIQDFLALDGINAVIYDHPIRPRNPRVLYHLEVRGGSSATSFVIRRMLPYLQVKKVKAEDILRFTKMFPKRGGGSLVSDWLIKEPAPKSLGVASLQEHTRQEHKCGVVAMYTTIPAAS